MACANVKIIVIQVHDRRLLYASQLHHYSTWWLKDETGIWSQICSFLCRFNGEVLQKCCQYDFELHHSKLLPCDEKKMGIFISFCEIINIDGYGLRYWKKIEKHCMVLISIIMLKGPLWSNWLIEQCQRIISFPKGKALCKYGARIFLCWNLTPIFVRNR